MDIVTPEDVAALLEPHQEGTAVSIYLPTHRMGPDTRQDPIRLKNLLTEARAALSDAGLRAPDVADLLSPATDLIDDTAFWQHQQGGLALFLDGDGMRSYRVAERFEPFAVVGDAFHAKPLLRAMSRGEKFYVLALSENQVRLLWGTRHSVGQVELPDDVPESLAEALWFEDPERQLQFRQATGMGAIFHGHGGGKDQPHQEIERFFRAVDDGLHHLIDRGAPLVLAGVERLLPIYRSVTEHDTVLEGEVVGNPDHLSPQDLHDRAWEMVQPWFDRERREAIAALNGDRSIFGTTEVIVAARQGRVASALVVTDAAVWGNPGDGETQPEVHAQREPGDRDLLDVVVADTWLKSGGAVWVVEADELPGEAPAAAVLRY